MTHLPVPRTSKSRASPCHPYPYLQHSTETHRNAGKMTVPARSLPIGRTGFQYRKHHTFPIVQAPTENLYYGQTRFSIDPKERIQSSTISMGMVIAWHAVYNHSGKGKPTMATPRNSLPFGPKQNNFRQETKVNSLKRVPPNICIPFLPHLH